MKVKISILFVIISILFGYKTNSKIDYNFECNFYKSGINIDTPKKIIPKVKLRKFASRYCKLTTKNLYYNYQIIESNLLKTFHILYDSIELDTNKFNFLIEVTMAESRLGYHTTLLKHGGTKGKGPWQIDRCAFNATKDVKRYPWLKEYHKRIKKETGIDWVKQVQWEHCNYVFFGATTAQLYLIIKKIEVEDALHERANQWKIHYNTYLGKGRPQDYLNRVEEVKGKLSNL